MVGAAAGAVGGGAKSEPHARAQSRISPAGSGGGRAAAAAAGVVKGLSASPSTVVLA